MIIDLRAHLRSPLQRRLYDIAGPLVERTLRLRGFNQCYERSRELYQNHPQGPSLAAWFDSTLRASHHTYQPTFPSAFQFPASGPLIVVANHPFGIVDPLVLGHFVASHRPDACIMANSMLDQMTELRPWLIPVDPFGGAGSVQRNLGAMKSALRHLRDGGTLILFPSGEISHWKPGHGINEGPWTPHLAALVRRTRATVLPVFFPGRNSPIFQSAGLVHPRLRTSLIAREFISRKHRTIPMTVGQPIPYQRLKHMPDDNAITRFLRLQTLMLAKRTAHPRSQPTANPINSSLPTTNRTAPLPDPAPAVTAAALAHEVLTLRTQGCAIADSGPFTAFIARADQIPHLLQEMGRLREVTFRAAGEGTGKDIDLDRFDAHYRHLFLWDNLQHRVAGAYRLGLADEILKQHGRRGLYTHTLFEFKKPFLTHLNDAIELGRSFIVGDYQRHPSALPLLWKAITLWISAHPRYTRLFGAVSISQDYHRVSRHMMVRFLREYRLNAELAPHVRPRHPFRPLLDGRLMKEFISAGLKDIDDCSALVSVLEEDRKGIPVLLKHYLRLNGTLISFNLDRKFASCIDGLILVDLTQSDPRLLSKYMGTDRCRDYLAQHGIPCPPAHAGTYSSISD